MSRIVSRWASLIGPETYSKNTSENPAFDPQNPVIGPQNRASDGTEEKSKTAENCHFREIRVTSWCQVVKEENATKPAETLNRHTPQKLWLFFPKDRSQLSSTRH